MRSPPGNAQLAKLKKQSPKSEIRPGSRVKCIKNWEDYNINEGFYLRFIKGEKLEVVEWEENINKFQPEGWFMEKFTKPINESRASAKARFHVSFVSDPLHEKVSVWSRIKSVALD